MPTEPYPAFAHDGYVYTPFTSVSTNREFQVLYRARLERATDPAAWELVQSGSFHHWEGEPTGGIWGQTFSAFVDDRGEMNVMYPALDAMSRGSIHVAHRPWNKPLSSNGFWVSGPRASATAVMSKTLGESLHLSLTATAVRGDAAWGLAWNSRVGFGSGIPTALRNCTTLQFDGKGVFVVSQLGGSGGSGQTELAKGHYKSIPGNVASTFIIRLEQHANGEFNVSVIVSAAKIVAANPAAANVTGVIPDAVDVGGGMIISVAAGVALHVTEMAVSQLQQPAVTVKQRWVSMTASEALSGAGAQFFPGWVSVVTDPLFKFGVGALHPGGERLVGYVFCFCFRTLFFLTVFCFNARALSSLVSPSFHTTRILVFPTAKRG